MQFHNRYLALSLPLTLDLRQVTKRPWAARKGSEPSRLLLDIFIDLALCGWTETVSSILGVVSGPTNSPWPAGTLPPAWTLGLIYCVFQHPLSPLLAPSPDGATVGDR